MNFKLPTKYRIVQTDNHGSDYPDESFLDLPPCSEREAEIIAHVINSIFCKDDYASRFWKVVQSNYNLQPGFEP